MARIDLIKSAEPLTRLKSVYLYGSLACLVTAAIAATVMYFLQRLEINRLRMKVDGHYTEKKQVDKKLEQVKRWLDEQRSHQFKDWSSAWEDATTNYQLVKKKEHKQLTQDLIDFQKNYNEYQQIEMTTKNELINNLNDYVYYGDLDLSLMKQVQKYTEETKDAQEDLERIGLVFEKIQATMDQAVERAKPNSSSQKSDITRNDTAEKNRPAKYRGKLNKRTKNLKKDSDHLLASLKTYCNRSVSQINAQRTDIDGLKQVIDDICSQLIDLESFIPEKAGKFKKIEPPSKKEASEVVQLSHTSIVKRQAVDRDFTKLCTKITNYSTENESTIDTLTIELQAEQRKIEQQNVSIACFKAQVEAQKSSIEIKINKIEILTSKNKNLTIDLQESRQLVNDQQYRITTFENQVKELETHHQANEEAIRKHTQTITKLKEELKNKEEEISKQKKTISELEESLAKEKVKVSSYEKIDGAHRRLVQTVECVFGAIFGSYAVVNGEVTGELPSRRMHSEEWEKALVNRSGDLGTKSNDVYNDIKKKYKHTFGEKKGYAQGMLFPEDCSKDGVDKFCQNLEYYCYELSQILMDMIHGKSKSLRTYDDKAKEDVQSVFSRLNAFVSSSGKQKLKDWDIFNQVQSKGIRDASKGISTDFYNRVTEMRDLKYCHIPTITSHIESTQTNYIFGNDSKISLLEDQKEYKKIQKNKEAKNLSNQVDALYSILFQENQCTAFELPEISKEIKKHYKSSEKEDPKIKKLQPCLTFNESPDTSQIVKDITGDLYLLESAWDGKAEYLQKELEYVCSRVNMLYHHASAFLSEENEEKPDLQGFLDEFKEQHMLPLSELKSKKIDLSKIPGATTAVTILSKFSSFWPGKKEKIDEELCFVLPENIYNLPSGDTA